MLFKQIRTYRHLQGIEGVLQRVVRVQLIDLVQELVHPLLTPVRHHHELDASESLVTVKFKCVCFQFSDS